MCMPNCNYYRDYLMMHTVGGFLRVLRVVHIEDLTPTPVTTFIFSVIVVYTSSVIFVNVTNTCIHMYSHCSTRISQWIVTMASCSIPVDFLYLLLFVLYKTSSGWIPCSFSVVVPWSVRSISLLFQSDFILFFCKFLLAFSFQTYSA